MATQYAFGQIVTSGLVLSLNAADKNSYPGSGTTWTDMSGNGNNGTLTNGPTFSSANGGSIVFDGVDDFVNVPNLTWTPTTFTVNWITFGNTRADFNQGIGAINGWGAFVFHTNSGGSIYVGTDLDNRLTPGQIPNNTYIANINQNFTFTYSGTVGSFYKNGILIASKAMNTPTAWGGFNIGGASGNTINGRVASLQIYSIALSAAQIQQNYDAQKSRFGL